jgi:hypothetical protein
MNLYHYKEDILCKINLVDIHERVLYMKEEIAVSNLIKFRNKVELFLMINSMIAFISFAIIGERYFIGYHPPLFIVELIAIPANIEMILLPSLIVIYIITYIRCLIKKIPSRITIKRAVGFLFVIITFLYIVWFFNGMRGSGAMNEIDKYQEGSRYYIKYGELNLRCTKNEYNLITADKSYLIQYSYNKLIPNKGSLEIVEILDDINEIK